MGLDEMISSASLNLLGDGNGSSEDLANHC